MAFVYWIHLPEHTDMFSEGYIGFTSNTVKARWKQHKDDAKRYKHLTIYKALVKYGDAIVVDTLVEGCNEYCLELENKLRPKNKIGWNIKIGGDVGSLGVIPSEETRQKMSECRLGDKNHFFGKTHTEDMKAKMSSDRKGKKPSDEARTKMSAARKGKKLDLSPEQRKNRSIKARSRKVSEETKQKLSVSRTGIKLSRDVITRMRKRRQENPWLNGRSNKILWSLAGDIYLLKQTNFSRTNVAYLYDIDVSQLTTIWKRLKNGWIPQADQNYIGWLDKTQESHCAET